MHCWCCTETANAIFTKLDKYANKIELKLIGTM